MDPYILTIGNFSIRWYSILILIGVILGITLIEKEGARFKISKDFLFNMCFWALIFGIIGARIYYVIFNYNILKFIIAFCSEGLIKLVIDCKYPKLYIKLFSESICSL